MTILLLLMMIVVNIECSDNIHVHARVYTQLAVYEMCDQMAVHCCEFMASLWPSNWNENDSRIYDVTTISISERFIFSCSYEEHLHFAKPANVQSNTISILFGPAHVEYWIQLDSGFV